MGWLQKGRAKAGGSIPPLLTNKFLHMQDIKGATFSEDKKYRYALWRTWAEHLNKLVFIGLNPSTADDKKDDPTIGKIIRIAKFNGYGGIVMINLFAIISPEPEVLLTCEDPIKSNDSYLSNYAHYHNVVLAWGNFTEARERANVVAPWFYNSFTNVYCLKANKNGSPKHPLYCPDASPLIPYQYGLH